MRKLSLLIATSVAMVALAGLSVPANADHTIDPDCDRTLYDNTFAVHDFDITTTSPDSGAVSSLGGRFLSCGVALHGSYVPPSPPGCGQSGQTPPEGRESLNVRADIKLPPGLEFNPASNIADGSFAGTATFNMAWCSGSISRMWLNQVATIRVERNTEGTDCPEDAIVCFWASSLFRGDNYNWVTRDGQGRYTLTFGPFHPFASIGESSLTNLKAFALCAYFGGTGASCGDSSRPWVMKNGNPSAPDCNGGNGPNGLFTVQVTRIGRPELDNLTAPVSKCVPWEPTVDPSCDGDPYDNDYAVHEFGVSTTPTTPGALSSITYNYLICGTALGVGSEGDDTVNDHVDIKHPGGSAIRNTSGIEPGSHAGELKGRIIYRDDAGDPQTAETEAELTVEWADLRFLERERWARDASNNWVKTNPIVDNCNRQADPGVSNVEGDNNRLGPDYLAGENIGTFDYQAWVPTDALGRPTTSLASFIPSCFKLVSTSGPFDWYAWVWGTFSVVDGHRHLTVGPIHTDTTPPAPDNDNPATSFNDRVVGFTSTSDNRDPFELTICANAGAPDTGCGGLNDPVLHRNGDGEGCYEIIATNKGAIKADAQTACVNWRGDRAEEPSRRDVKPCNNCTDRTPLGRKPSSGGDSGGRDDSATGTGAKAKQGGAAHSGRSSHRGTKTRGLRL